MKILVRHLTLLAIAGLFCNSCEGQDLDDWNENCEDWIEKVEAKTEVKVKRVYSTGGIDNTYAGHSGQGVAVRDRIMYRLYNTGQCQTYDLTDLTNPVKLGSFDLGSHQYSNHSNCAQTYLDDNGNVLLYVSGQKNGKAYVERVTTTGSSLVQVITIAKMAILENTNTLNAICGDDGYLWLFGSSANKLLFAKARRPLLSERDALLDEDDILDVWSEDGYVYGNDVWQGGKVYNGLLFFLFGSTGSKAHLAVFDTHVHHRIADISLSGIFKEEPEDCELLPEGILIVTNGGSNYYLIKPE